MLVGAAVPAVAAGGDPEHRGVLRHKTGPGPRCARSCWRRSTCSACSPAAGVGGPILATFVIVFLYATFLLVERAAPSEAKLANMRIHLSARPRVMIQAINRRIGSQIGALKTLPTSCSAWSAGVMRLYGLDARCAVVGTGGVSQLQPLSIDRCWRGLSGADGLRSSATWHDPDLAGGLERRAVRHRQLRPLCHGQLAQSQPFAIPISLGRMVRAGASRRLSGKADHRDHDHIVFSEFPARGRGGVAGSKSGKL